MMKMVNFEEENLIDLRNFNEIFRKDVTHDNTKIYEKAELHSLSRKYIFEKRRRIKLIPPILFRVKVY